MPLEHFFAPPPRRTSIVRNHPLMVATTAASAGVLLGAYVAVQLLVTPPAKQDDGTRPTAQATAESKAAPARAETTGQAPSSERDVAATDCSRQTWPHLSRDCMELNKSGPRVVSTDRLDQPTVNAIEKPPTRAIENSDLPAAAPANRPAPSVAPAAPPAAAVTAAVTPPESAAQPAAPPAVAVPPAVAATPAAALPVTTTAQETAGQETAPPKAAKTKQAKKPKQKTKPDDRALARADDEDDVEARESNGERRTFSSAPDRSRRIGERWTEREYDVPSSDGHGQRRVIVIRRNDGGSTERRYGDGGLFERRDSGGLFGSLFGFR